ncbi:hypothetical protein FRZ67_22720 [Panacibacter ginsenosidivorans]|uniref:DUF748 domain-containing protein n=1 Tax=Panacibacter ginsenosidivorans TaxID=1813871 RepID=A0A5B8VG40_9BACT|nr:hypothetical protein [Panacibacter ginsenosidivorans]QEC69972.1 hypothetical protein FRZ67_22720 [Panacibacter ginsenosidivorans]
MKPKWIILISVIIVISGALLYLKFRSSTDFEPLIKAKLQQLVKDGSNGLYRLDVERINVEVLDQQIVVLNASLNIDSARLIQLDKQQQAPNDIYKIAFKNLVIEGIGPDDLLKKKNIDLNTFYIKDPVVEIFHQKRDYNYVPPDTTTLYKKIANQIGHFSVKQLLVQNVDFKYHNISKENKLTHLKNVTVNLNEILIDSTTQIDSTRFLYAKNANIILKDYEVITSDSLYNFHIDSFSLNASSHFLDATGLSLKPRGKKENFSQKLSYYKDLYDINIANASVKNIDWWQLVSEDGFTASQVKLSNGDVEVFADRTLPDPHKNKVGNYPHQLLMRLNLPVMIDTIKVKDFKVTFTELNNKTKKKGSVVFDDISGTFTNVTNRKEVIAKNNFFTLDAHAKLMSAGALHALFKFDLANVDKGNFSLDLEVGSMDGKLLNTATKTLGLFEIKNADINKISAHIDANNYKSNGTVSFFYKYLEVAVLKQDEEENNKLKKRGLISFIANNFVIAQSNTGDDKNKDPKKVSYKRDPEKSFFNLIWKTLFTGLSATVKGENQ